MGQIVRKITKNNVDYRLLDYIQSTGIQYINTGIKGNSNIIAKIKVKSIVQTECHTAGQRLSRTEQRNGFLGLINAGGTQLRSDYGNEEKIYSNLTTSDILNGFELDINKNVYKLSTSTKSEILTFTSQTFSNNLDVVLFGLNSGGSIGNFAKYSLQSCHISDGITILDLIPVERVNDNVLGMLDLVSGNLYTNAGSGTFTKGTYKYVDDISVEKIHLASNNELVAEVDYIQSSGTQYLTTNVKPNGNERFEISFTPLEWRTDNNNVVCGARNGNTYGIYVFGSIVDTYGGGARLSNFGFNQALNKPMLNVKHTIKYLRTDMWLDENKFTAIGRQLYQVASNMLIFAGATDGQAISGFTKMKLHNFIIYNEDETIKENWIPVKVLSTGVYCMLDTISGTLHYNSGTGNFTGPSTRLVKELWPKITLQNTSYYILDYIQATGSQYVDTGYKPNQNTILEIKYQLDDQNSNPIIFGGSSSWTNNVFSYYRGTNVIYDGYGNGETNLGSQNTNPHILRKEKNKTYLDGVLAYTHSATTFQSSNSLRIGSVFDKSNYMLKGKVFYCKIWENDELKKDYIAVKRISDNKVGLLDLVSGTLEGSGTFIAGNNKKLTLIE